MDRCSGVSWGSSWMEFGGVLSSMDWSPEDSMFAVDSVLTGVGAGGCCLPNPWPDLAWRDGMTREEDDGARNADAFRDRRERRSGSSFIVGVVD